MIDNSCNEGFPLRLTSQVRGHVAGAGHAGRFESAILTCAHCHTTVVLNPQRDRPRGYCAACDHYVCDKPGCNAGCFPMSRVFDIALELAMRGEGQIEERISQLRRDVLGEKVENL